MYTILVWSGTDPFLAWSLGDAAYQEAQLGFTVVGDGGVAVVVLAWLVCANACLSGQGRVHRTSLFEWLSQITRVSQETRIQARPGAIFGSS